MTDISSLDKFIGRAVEVITTSTTKTFTTLGITKTFENHELVAGQKLFEEITQERINLGLKQQRIFLPGYAGTCDYCTDRLNVNIQLSASGGWQIVSFDVG